MKWNLGWKTLAGAAVTALGYVSQPEVLAIMPSDLAGIVTAAGYFLSMFGLRAAVAR